MIKLDHVPEGIEGILAVYGRPFDDEGELDKTWYAENTRLFNLPVDLRLSWKPEVYVSRIRTHKLVGDAMIDALAEIAWQYRDRLHIDGLDMLGGTYNYRFKRGGRNLSTHAWGIAIDLNPQIGGLGDVEAARLYPKPIIDAFTKRGFMWGGSWTVPDAMHFQAAAGY
jgi:hypothetical protein